MLIGHFGFGLGAKKFAPKLSLGLLFIAVQWADLLWPVLVLLGIEHAALQPENKNFPIAYTDYPISHSLLMGLVWGSLFALVCWAVLKDTRTSIVLGICVLSHWVLDLFVHKSDLPLFPGNSPLLGFGLWNWPLVTGLIEFSIFGAGLVMYLRSTVAKNKTGKWSFWLLVVLLVVSHITGQISPLPTSLTALCWGGQSMWLFVLLGFWADRNRVSRTAETK